MIKKAKRQHQLWTEWNTHIKGTPMVAESTRLAEQYGFKEGMFEQPMAGRWYYTYSNDKGMAVGLAKLKDIGLPYSKRKWMWETCTANEELELRRFSTQKAAEKVIYEFLK